MQSRSPSLLLIATIVCFAYALAFREPVGYVKWNQHNCDDGDVTDAACCHDNHCDDLGSKRACDLEKTCLWNFSLNTCKANRDVDNNVCCMRPMNWCDDITKGKCPEDFQVPAECCALRHQKWDGVLSVEVS